MLCKLGFLVELATPTKGRSSIVEQPTYVRLPSQLLKIYRAPRHLWSGCRWFLSKV
jgi:hypothetical protein